MRATTWGGRRRGKLLWELLSHVDLLLNSRREFYARAGDPCCREAPTLLSAPGPYTDLLWTPVNRRRGQRVVVLGSCFIRSIGTVAALDGPKLITRTLVTADAFRLSAELAK